MLKTTKLGDYTNKSWFVFLSFRTLITGLLLICTILSCRLNATTYAFNKELTQHVDSILILNAHKTQRLSIEEALGDDKTWTQISNLSYGLPVDPFDTWIKFSLRAAQADDVRYLIFGQALRVDQVNFWLLSNNLVIDQATYQAQHQTIAGKMRALPNIKIVLTPEQDYQVLINIRSNVSGYLPLTIKSEALVDATRERNQRMQGAVIGIFSFAAAVFLLAALIGHRRTNLLIAVMLVSFLLSMLAWLNLTGFSPAANDLILLMAFAAAVLALATMHRASLSRFSRAELGVLILIGLGLTVSLSLDSPTNLLLLLGSTLTVIAILLVQLLAKAGKGKWVNLAALGLLAVATTVLLVDVGLDQPLFFHSHLQLLLVSYLTIALAAALLGFDRLMADRSQLDKSAAEQQQLTAQLTQTQAQLTQLQKDVEQQVATGIAEQLAQQKQDLDDWQQKYHQVAEQLANAEADAEDALESAIQERTLELNIALQELEEANRELEKKNTTDELSGLYNRRFFDQRFLAEYRRSKRELTPLSLVLIDIDHFKKINDTHGHLVGDQCIRQVGKLLKQQLKRSSDVACRYGGEEFCLILPHTETEGAVAFADSLREIIASQPLTLDNTALSVTISAGVVTYQQQQGVGLDDIFKQVDAALYQAKKNGRNQIQQQSLASAT